MHTALVSDSIQWTGITSEQAEYVEPTMGLVRIPMVIQPIHHWLLAPPVLMWETWDYGGNCSFGFAEGMPAIRFYDPSGNVIRMPDAMYLKIFIVND